MTLELDTNGLPKPGRELDAWIEEHVMSRRHVSDRQGDEFYFWPSLAEVKAITKANPNILGIAYEGARLFSTTHAFFQVMEAMRSMDQEWQFVYSFDKQGLWMQMESADKSLGYVVHVPWRETIEETNAHAVCCCAWKWKGGQ